VSNPRVMHHRDDARHVFVRLRHFFVQTKTERVNTVFAVKVQIPNPQMELKPGMPADAAPK
jgi:hypothetical protein